MSTDRAERAHDEYAPRAHEEEAGVSTEPLDLSGLHVYEYTSAGWGPGEDPESPDDVAARWEKALRGNGYRPHGDPDFQLSPHSYNGWTCWRVSGYVVKQEGVRDVTFRAPVPAGGENLTDHVRAAREGWEKLVASQGLEPHGPLSVRWCPGARPGTVLVSDQGEDVSVPAWVATGPARPAEPTRKSVNEHHERPSGRRASTDRAERAHNEYAGVVFTALDARTEPTQPDWMNVLRDAAVDLNRIATSTHNGPDAVDWAQNAMRHLAGLWLSAEEAEALTAHLYPELAPGEA